MSIMTFELERQTMADVKKRTGLARFTSEEITDIIKACSQGKVHSFNYNGLALELTDGTRHEEAQTAVGNVHHEVSDDLLVNSSFVESPLALAQDADSYLEDLDIEDPLAFEEHIQSKDAVN